MGKSFILNALVGNREFRSGISIGEGLTKELQKVEHDGQVFCDTPGLDDMFNREQAANVIFEALSGEGKYKLIFVCTLESGGFARLI